MSNLPLILSLRLPIDVDRSEFEPDAQWWTPAKHPQTAFVNMYVKREGAYLVGATGIYRESLEDIVADSHRFCMLVADQTQIVL